ncbi:MAG TPA: LacI family DNA-binding transcriptional regulator [Kofleriaceae bacterium]|nr:LacI family DNA-binding transcriptional regulator [Kofleriaceae bacterium]
MKRVVRLADVAKAAGVSQGTASNVFNRPHLVRDEVRERVERSARRLGYGGPDPKGRLLRAGKVNAIGFVSANEMAYFFEDPFARLLTAGIAEVCDEHGAGMSLVPGASRESAAWSVQTALVDGFIVYCLEDGDRLIELARRRNLPFVSIDLDAGPGTSSILVEDERGAHLAASHLLELGHRKIGFLSMEPHGDSRFGWVDAELIAACACKVERDRLSGYLAALAEHGVSLEGLPIMVAPNDRRGALPYVSQLLERVPGITAIAAMSDILAMAAIDAARARGLRVPEDLSVIGFDDIPDAAAADPPLTTIAQPIAEKGRRAARLIFEPGEPRKELLEVKLVVRASTAPAPAPRKKKH